MSFFRRETIKQSIIDSSRKEGKKNKFLCAKRTNKKKRKMYNAEYNDGEIFNTPYYTGTTCKCNRIILFDPSGNKQLYIVS